MRRIVASGTTAHPEGFTEEELVENVAAHKLGGFPVEPCGFCGKETTMVSYVIGSDTPQGRAHLLPHLVGYRVPACCGRDACIDRMDSSEYTPPPGALNMKVRSIHIGANEAVELAPNEIVTERNWNARDGGFDVLIEELESPVIEPTPGQKLDNWLGSDDSGGWEPREWAHYSLAIAAGLAAFGQAMLAEPEQIEIKTKSAGTPRDLIRPAAGNKHITDLAVVLDGPDKDGRRPFIATLVANQYIGQLVGIKVDCVQLGERGAPDRDGVLIERVEQYVGSRAETDTNLLYSPITCTEGTIGPLKQNPPLVATAVVEVRGSIARDVDTVKIAAVTRD